MVEKGKPKEEVEKLLKIGIASVYRWLKKKATGESLKPAKMSNFIRKIDPKMLAEYVKKHPG
ncbi:MAG: hypothetical protein sL5_06410 [Candidatus Mesenet longicola]|uniref:Transposase Synechocystis PCC 6803 domain-containing protein n=1 Tax=Candidatus Mesenet longicola TaxID=1892558 RepID=A0A8J3HSW4_9RICK|nr:MAG: hypothetical protein sGL2_06480 [Candidatus Mesenet longicola]GHM59648.1 MAG: hypothetical protein sL5_06410 [Candidatus Mesenet longicola]